jgi:predicted metal-dependent hydrolase
MDVRSHAFLEGVRLFNEGHYWHAHEQWEACWLASSEPEATFYKGIIQAAAALVHWQKHNLRGLRRNWAKSRPKLVAAMPLVDMLDILGLIAAMDRLVIAEGQGPAPRLCDEGLGAGD